MKNTDQSSSSTPARIAGYIPGPWHVDPNGELPDRPYRVSKLFYCIADVGNEDDARLIAAAPELLYWLGEVLEHNQRLRDARLAGDKKWIEARTGALAYAEQQARAAISKAEGRG